MTGVHDIGVLGEGRLGDGGTQLRPVGRSHNDDGIGIDGANGRDDLVGVVADGRPCHAIGLVADLIEDVRGILVGGRHLFPERDGLVDVRVGIPGCEDVPVDDGIHPLVHGLRDDVVDLGEVAVHVIDVSVRPFGQIHGDAADIGADIVREVIEGTRRDTRAPSISP
jgi:hypothetical protein